MPDNDSKLAPNHTDLMVTPEAIDAFTEANPPSAEPNDRDPHAVIIDAAYEWRKADRKCFEHWSLDAVVEFERAKKALVKAVLWNGEPQ